MSDKIYLVAGATGGVGQQVVSRLLRRNEHVRALVRDLTKARALLGENLELIEGDARRIDSAHEAVRGVQVVICTLGARPGNEHNTPEQVDYEGVSNLVKAAVVAGVERFVLVSSLAVTRPDHPLNQYGRILDWKLKGEEALRGSGLVYTIIRPGGLNDEAGGVTGLTFDQGDRISGRISRADVAEVVLQALARDSARNVTFEVISADGGAPATPDAWDALFLTLRSDLQTGMHG
jgi:uncharacterized protein YbjT (DUF2867 family)